MAIGTASGDYYDSEFEMLADQRRSQSTMPPRGSTEPVDALKQDPLDTPTGQFQEKPSQVADASDFFKGLYNRFTLPSAEKYKLGEDKVENKTIDAHRTEYPTGEDVRQAQFYDQSYAQPYAKFFNEESAKVFGQMKDGTFNMGTGTGKYIREVYSMMEDPKVVTTLDLDNNPQIKNRLEAVYAKAALATNRSGLAALGFDPRRSVLDLLPKKEDVATIAGAYDDKRDNIYFNLSHDPSTIVHESMHRGIKILTEKNAEAKEILGKLKSGGVSEESVVRYLINKTLGDIEKGAGPIGEKQIESAKYWFEKSLFSKDNRKLLDELEGLAQAQIGKRGKRSVQSDEQPDELKAGQQYAMMKKDDQKIPMASRGEGGGGLSEEPAKKLIGYRIWDNVEKKYIGSQYKADPTQRKRMRSRIDKMDNEYGAYRYIPRMIFEGDE